MASAPRRRPLAPLRGRGYCASRTPPFSGVALTRLPLPRRAAQPVEGIKKSAENLGEHLSGELIENSGYEVRARRGALRCADFMRARVSARGMRVESDALSRPPARPSPNTQLEMKTNQTCKVLCTKGVDMNEVRTPLLRSPTRLLPRRAHTLTHTATSSLSHTRPAHLLLLARPHLRKNKTRSTLICSPRSLQRTFLFLSSALRTTTM